MKIGVLGTGTVGQTIAAKLTDIGHDVTIGTRDVGKTVALAEPNAYGQPPFSAWAEQHPRVVLRSYSEAAKMGEVVINATNGGGSLAALSQAGGDNLAGKILIDIANPLDFSHGMPPTLLVSNTDSLGEQIQRAFPETKVVKALNTLTASLMVAPRQLADGDHDLLVCGNDAGAKKQVAEWLRTWFGWKSIIDLGDISASRGTEMYLPIWLRLWGALGTGVFNIKVVK